MVGIGCAVFVGLFVLRFVGVALGVDTGSRVESGGSLQLVQDKIIHSRKEMRTRLRIWEIIQANPVDRWKSWVARRCGGISQN